jgi:diguanylate cyclase (GGDEF)-like protein
MPHTRISTVALADWDILFSAVKSRLRRTVGAGGSGAAELQPGSPASEHVSASVLECVAALDQLQATLKQELDRCAQVSEQLFDAQTRLAQARVELAGTQAGERRARHMAMHDGLTALPNRGFFLDQLGYSLAHLEPGRQSLGVLYLDLDGFKAINDRHGHGVGDDLLKIVAARLTRAVRSVDMVSRLGGDEFACLPAHGLGPEQLRQLAVKLFDAISAPFKLDKLMLSVRPSIGIAMCPKEGASAAALLQFADAAMYQAKRAQSGYAFFNRSGSASRPGTTVPEPAVQDHRATARQEARP